MKKLISVLLVSVFLAISLLGCTATDPLIDDIYTQNIYPSDNVTYDLGSTTLSWGDGYFDDVYIDGVAVGGSPKAGTITTDANGVATVTFNTAFADANYAISLCAESGTDAVVCMWNTKVAGSFRVKTEDDEGNDEPNIEVLWIATPYSDP